MHWKRLVYLLLVIGVALVSAAAVTYRPGGDPNAGKMVTNSIGMRFAYIPAGTFQMGSDEKDECPVRTVTLTKPFYLGVTEVTQAQYEKVMDDDPSYVEGEKLPVDRVTWNDAQVFCRKLSQMDKSGTYRLPTEAEWEHACRAGTTTPYYWGRDFDDSYAWHRDNAGHKSQEVGTRKPNAWGLYDMSGNMWEWVQDYYADENPAGPLTDPTGPEKGTLHVIRGGSWYTGPTSLRSSNRHRRIAHRGEEDTSFRVVYVPKDDPLRADASE